MTPRSSPARATVHIRPATPADVPRLAPLFEQYRAFYGMPDDVGAARRFLGDRLARGESTVFIAIAEDPRPDPVGFVQLYASFSSLAMRRIVILNDLFVAPGWRRAGIGRRLMTAAIDHAVASDAAHIELATQHANGPALALYRELGFQTESEFVRLHLTLPRGRAPERFAAPE